jgi:hypothetical protein
LSFDEDGRRISHILGSIRLENISVSQKTDSLSKEVQSLPQETLSIPQETAPNPSRFPANPEETQNLPRGIELLPREKEAFSSLFFRKREGEGSGSCRIFCGCLGKQAVIFRPINTPWDASAGHRPAFPEGR